MSGYKQISDRKMAVKAAIFVISIALMTLCGCPGETKRIRQDSAADLLTPEGMAQYLKDVPSVQATETWQNEYGPGIIIKTRHYRIYTTLLDPLMLRQLPGFMESAHRAYQNQLPEPIETQTAFDTYLFDTRSQWEDFTKTFVPRQWPVYLKIQKGAYYLNGRCVAYNIGRTRTFAVLGHEGWHQFNSRHFTFRLPSWLDEGISTLFETCRYDRGVFHFEPGRNLGRLGALRKTILDDSMIPLPSLIGLNPGQVVSGSDTDAVMAFYAQSYALVRFLREDNYGRRLANYHNLLLAALRGNWPLDDTLKRIASDRNIPMTVNFNRFVSPRLFSLYIDSDMAALEEQYLAFCKKLVYHVRLQQQ